MKRFTFRMAALLLCLTALPWCAWADTMLVPVGRVVGLEIGDDRVVVAAYDDAFGDTARNAGLKIGDQIVNINGKTVSCVEDIRSALDSGGDTVEVTVRRGSKLSCLSLTPRQTEEGPRMGVYLRQGISGIGTVTFYDPQTGMFGTLGHGVSDAAGSLLRMTRGNAYSANVISVKRGKTGDPGQLKGGVESMAVFGSLLKNTPQGVFGMTHFGWEGEAIATADYEAITPGPACVRCQVEGEDVREYSVEILRCYPRTRTDGRNFLIRITDPALLECTAGIVQGMSGSPIIQDGKLVGAVTHVCVFG